MKFLVILAALAINHYWERDRTLPGDDWFRHLSAWLYARAKAVGGGATLFLLLCLLLPALVMLGVLALVQGALMGLVSLFLHVALLLCLFDPRHLRGWTNEYLRLWREEDFEGAFLLLQERRTALQLDNVEDVSALHAQACRYLVGTCFQRLFCVLFWYLLAGPAGALVYYCLSQLQQNRMFESEWESERWASGLLYLMEWVPARVLALTFSLAGDFEAGFQSLRDQLLDTSKSGESLVTATALAASGSLHKALLVHESADEEDGVVIDVEDSADEDSPAGMGRQLRNLLALIDRSQMLWVAALALLTLFGSAT